MKRLNLGRVLTDLSKDSEAVITWDQAREGLYDSAWVRISNGFTAISISRTLTTFGMITVVIATDAMHGVHARPVKEAPAKMRALVAAEKILRRRGEGVEIIPTLDAKLTGKVAA